MENLAIWIILSCLLTFVLSALLTFITRIYTLKKNILDIPNERSSHVIPTPRGGGIAIVLTFLLTVFCLDLYDSLSANLVHALMVGGSAIAILGYCDDIYQVKTGLRIILHFAIAAWAVYCLGGFPFLDLGTFKLALGLNGAALAIIGIVWCINLYNFMDGIDGLASGEGFFVALAAGCALMYTNHITLAFSIWLLAASIAGFMVWNWPPAKIFLGDVGSGFLGYVFAVLGVYCANQGALPITFWLIVLAVFLCDATITVIYRASQGKRWYAAHREHAYQALIQSGTSHKQVTLSILVVNMLILLPLACAALYWPTYAFWFMSSTLTFLSLLWIYIKLKHHG